MDGGLLHEVLIMHCDRFSQPEFDPNGDYGNQVLEFFGVDFYKLFSFSMAFSTKEIASFSHKEK